MCSTTSSTFGLNGLKRLNDTNEICCVFLEVVFCLVLSVMEERRLERGEVPK
jgi:hypothetical protein